MNARALLLATCVAVVLVGAIAFDPPRRDDLGNGVSVGRITPVRDPYLCQRVAKSPFSVAIGPGPETPECVLRRPDAESIGELPYLSICIALESIP